MIGIDIVKISRIEALLEKHSQKALTRFLTKEEIALAKTPQTVAGFYAAKEAVAKALGCGISRECGFHDIHLHKDHNGAPYFTLAKPIVTAYGITETALSITHDGGFAIAVVSLRTSREKNRPLCH